VVIFRGILQKARIYRNMLISSQIPHKLSFMSPVKPFSLDIPSSGISEGKKGFFPGAEKC
jgi:hypothetical protein